MMLGNTAAATYVQSYNFTEEMQPVGLYGTQNITGIFSLGFVTKNLTCIHELFDKTEAKSEVKHRNSRKVILAVVLSIVGIAVGALVLWWVVLDRRKKNVSVLTKTVD
jgi:hypothetical protein